MFEINYLIKKSFKMVYTIESEMCKLFNKLFPFSMWTPQLDYVPQHSLQLGHVTMF